MFEPHFEFTYFTLACLDKLAELRGSVRGPRLDEEIIASVERNMFVRSVHSSTKIEGNRLTLDDVAALHAGKPTEARGEQRLEVVNAIAAMRHSLREKREPFDEAALLRLHGLMTCGLLVPEKSGRYRTIQNYIADGNGRIIETPPPHKEVVGRMKALFAWLSENLGAHPLVRAAVFHHEFVTIHPFTDGNGRVARAASQRILWNGGLPPWSTLALDEFYANDRGRYYEMISETKSMDGDMTHWIEYTAEGLAYAVDRAGARKRHVIEQSRGELTDKESELLMLLKKNGPMGSSELCAQMGVNRARINQLVVPLLACRAVERSGKARSTRYRYVIS